MTSKSRDTQTDPPRADVERPLIRSPLEVKLVLLAASLSDRELDRAWLRFSVDLRSVVRKGPSRRRPRRLSSVGVAGALCLGHGSSTSGLERCQAPLSSTGSVEPPRLELRCLSSALDASVCGPGTSLFLWMELPDALRYAAVVVRLSNGRNMLLVGDGLTLADVRSRRLGPVFDLAFTEVGAWPTGEHPVTAWFCDQPSDLEKLLALEASTPLEVDGACCHRIELRLRIQAGRSASDFERGGRPSG